MSTGIRRITRLQAWVLLALMIATTASTRRASAQQQLDGVVVDAETREALAGVHVLLDGTTIGVVTNDEGRFTLTTPTMPADLRMRHIGYQTLRRRVEAPPPAEIVIELVPAVVELEEIFVTGETFAENLMREVIAAKQEWLSALSTYEAQGFSRITLERDDTIVHVSEAAFNQYWDRELGARAVVTRFSRTADWYDDLPLPPSAFVPNLYGDYVDIHGLAFIGPTHPDALDHYAFRLAGRRMQDERVVYDIYVSPRDERLATFIGTVSVFDSVFALAQAELRPARHIVFPQPLVDWRMTYAQQFRRIDGGTTPHPDLHADGRPWLPVDLRIDGTATVALDARRRRVFNVHQRAQISRYKLNNDLPTAPFAHSEQVVHDETALLNDPHFIYGRVLMPMTARETEAIERLRAEPLALRSAFPPMERDGWLASFLAGEPGSVRLKWPTIMGYEFRFRHNRVDGFRTSVGRTLDFSPRLQVEWRLAQATGLRRVRSHVRIRRTIRSLGFAEFAYGRDIQPRQLSHFSIAATSLQPLTGGDDYFDFYWVDGGTISGGISTDGLMLSAGLTIETHRSVAQNLEKTWPFGERFRPNPEITEGRLGSVAIALNWMTSKPINEASVRSLSTHIEHAPGGIPALDYDFTRFQVEAEVHIPTFFRRRPRPAALDLKITAGTSSGRLPTQRYFALDGTLTLLDVVHIGRFGTFRTLHGRTLEGERDLGVFWKHDFTPWPFERGFLWPLAQLGTRVELFGGHGRTWISSATLEDLPFVPFYHDGTVHELGVSLSSIGGSPLRIDAAARVDRPGFSVTIGATLGGLWRRD